MHVKDKQTGKYVIKNPKTKEVANEVRELRKKEAEGKFVAEREKDCLFYALGEKPDHPGRAKGFGGVNISVREAFGAPTVKIGSSSKSGTSPEEREAIKNELREEFRDVFKSELKSDVLAFLQQLGLKLPNAVENEICPNNAEGNQLEPSLPLIVKNDTPCRLFLSDPHSGVSYEVARGKTFPVEEGEEGSIVLDNVRVKVSIVHEEFQSLPLPVPVQVYDLHVLSDAVGSFVQWPVAFVRLEEEGDQNVMKKGLEVLGSTSHHSRLSVTPTKTPAKELMVESLSPDCQWLNTLIGTMGDGESFDIYFDADLFYFEEDGKTEVYKDDLKEFLKWSVLSISIIQIFIRAIRDDLMKADTRPRLGWLCPDATSDTKLIKNTQNAIAYLTSAFQKADINDDKFILAPIFDSKHWLLLVISPQTYTIYEFDSISLKEGRKLYMKMVVLSALKRYKMSGGKLKNNRREPLWKSMKCPQQSGDVECGLFVLRFMYDIVKSCTTVEDLEKVWSSTKEDVVYTECEINQIRDKWASYFTSRCIS